MEPLGAGDPRQIGAYRLLGRLGAGGMGRVYLGRTAGGRTVAVKLVRSELADDGEFRARFRQEVEAARRVQNYSASQGELDLSGGGRGRGGGWTAPVLDADTESEQPWVATGYVPGPGLDAAVREFGPLPEASVRVLGVGLVDALGAVHATGLVHRDLKPSNVLLTLAGPRLIDFGIARALDAATALTRSGYVVGSPGYMSPEQGAGETAGWQSDVFSLGGVLAYAATGVGPFGDSVSAPVLLYRVIHEPPRLDSLAAGPLREAVERCLAKVPGDRPALAELREALGGAGPVDGWLPPLLVASVGRRTAELLDLEAEAEAGFGPAPAMFAQTAPAVPTAQSAPSGQPARYGQFAPGRPTPPGGQPQDATPPGGSVPEVALGGPHPEDAPPRKPLWRSPALIAGAVLVVLAAVLVPLLLHNGTPSHVVSGDGGSTSAPPTQSATTPAPSSTSAAPPSPPAAPSAGASTPNAVPAAFLGTWTGTITTQDGAVSSQMSITIRPGPIGAENSTSISVTPVLPGLACEGGETLQSASAKQLVFKGRLLPSSNPTFCSSGSTAETYTLNADGTLHHTSQDAPAGNPSGDFHRVR